MHDKREHHHKNDLQCDDKKSNHGHLVLRQFAKYLGKVAFILSFFHSSTLLFIADTRI